MIIEDAISFLKEAPPFQFLDETTLKSVAGSLSLEFYPKDTVVLMQDGPPSVSLRIIKKGAVKVFMRSETGEDVLLDYKGEGDNFGFLSMFGTERQRTTCIAVEDTICYVLQKEKVQKLIESSQPFSEYFMSYLSRYVDRTYKEMRDKSMSFGSRDRYLFTTSVGDVASAAITISEDATIQEAAEFMVLNKISSLIIVDRNNQPAGIVTDRDFSEKVIAAGRNVSEPIKNVMTRSLIRTDAGDSCFEAVLKMIQHNIHHILVTKEGKLKGVMNNHDLMLLQGTSPLSFANDIGNQQTIEGLASVSSKMDNVVGFLLKEGAKASNITKIMTEINDRVVSKILEIGERKYGKPPVPYCWIVLGAEGRKEQFFKTCQDNAIIYGDPATPEEEDAARTYFSVFTAFVGKSLMKAGFPLCQAHFTANDQQWCKPLKFWKRYFSALLSEPTQEVILKSLLLFDFRPICGALSLTEELRDAFQSAAEGQGIFFGHMANMITKNTPPVGFLKSFVVEKSGEHKDEFDLQAKGIHPLVDAVRLFALEKGARETSTIERIAALRDKHSIMRQYADELEHIFEFFMLLLIQHQFEQIKEEITPDNFINPDNLSNLEKKTLKEAFHVITKLQGLIIEKYKPFIV